MKRFFALFAALTLFCTGISAQTAACRTETGIAYRDAAEAEDGQPRRVLLSQNFRSRRQVLSAANFVFGSIMSRQMGEMDYGPE